MRKTKTRIRAEKREQKNRKRMHLSGGSLRKSSKHGGMAIIQTDPKKKKRSNAT